MLSGGRNRYQFVHANDPVEALVWAGNAKARKLTTGASSFGTMREVLEHLCHHAGSGSRVKSLPMWLMVPAMNLSSDRDLTAGRRPLAYVWPLDVLRYFQGGGGIGLAAEVFQQSILSLRPTTGTLITGPTCFKVPPTPAITGLR